MITTIGGLELSRHHVAALAAVDEQDRAEQERAEAEREAFAMRCLTMAPVVQEILQLQRAAADRQAALAEQAAQRERDERVARARDNTALLIGAGRVPRTVREILAAQALFS